MPYFVPGCELSRIGIRTMVFPSRMVTSACDQLIPAVRQLALVSHRRIVRERAPGAYTARAMADTTIPENALSAFLDALDQGNVRAAERFPGDSPHRQPVHTVYGGAHLFKADAAPKLGALALKALNEHAPDPAAFATAIGLDPAAAERIYARVVEKLTREPVEDFRIDFEDGFGTRPDQEEDAFAQ